MSAPEPTAKVLVLSEDGGKHGTSTIQSILRHMLGQIAPGADLGRIDLRPFGESSVVHGNIWKSAKKTATAGIVDLASQIARYLVFENGFVVHHVDGDRIWAERATSENMRKYQEVIVRRVREHVRKWTAKKKRGSGEVDARMSRLVVLAPFWCIEAWLFQNTDEARLHCSDVQHECAARLTAWSNDRKLLDEERTTKKLLCFHDTHNLALAGPRFPNDDVLTAAKSYSAALQALRECTPLVDALARTATK